MVHALEAGTIVAVTAGATGWFMVLRRQAFAGHTLATIAFPGAAGAILVGVPAVAGSLGFCGASALVLGVTARRRSGSGDDSAATGSLQALGLALGFLFVGLYGGILGDLTSLLFGTFLGVDSAQVLVLLGVGAAALTAIAVSGRPLLFASLEPDLAQARGVRVRLLGVGFLVVLGLTVAVTSQITGALLVFALLVLPAATAQRLTARPFAGIALSVGIGLLVTWLGLVLAYYSTRPVGFYVTSLAFGLYAVVRALEAGRG